MDEQKEEERIKCNRCKVKLLPSNFSVKRDGVLLKTCDKCREKAKKSKEKNKCEHGRRRNRCKDCGGTSICEHDRIRSTCKDCGGASICEHNRIRSRCKDCGGGSICEHDRKRSQCKQCSDPIKVTINNWISHSRQSDKKKDRYDANNFIDKCFLKGLVEDYQNCYYCTTPLQYIEYNDDLATIERIDNTLGHIKSNCVIACRKCNVSRIGDSR
jgi:mannitol-specific phosphotransferase system IIBC component